MRYEATYRNLTFKQAKAMYRIALNLEDDEPMIGEPGSTWSGLIPGTRTAIDPENQRGERTITISPMEGEA